MDINILVLEDFSRGDLGFYNSSKDQDTKKISKHGILKIHDFLNTGKIKEDADDIKTDKASTVTGISTGVSHAMQKFSAPFGGINKFLNKPDINQDQTPQQLIKMRNKAVKSFNKSMGEKVL